MPVDLTANGWMAFDDAPSRRSSAVQVVPGESIADADNADSGLPDERRRAAWMAAAQAGDRSAYERVLGDSVALVRAVARRLGVPREQSDDVVQETLLAVHRVRHTYDPARSYDAWLAAIAGRRAIDALRSRGRREARETRDASALDALATAGDATDATERAQAARRLRTAIDALPPGQREAVEQLGLAERSLQEAAERTGRSTGALKVNLHRAIKALRRSLQGGP